MRIKLLLLFFALPYVVVSISPTQTMLSGSDSASDICFAVNTHKQSTDGSGFVSS